MSRRFATTDSNENVKVMTLYSSLANDIAYEDSISPRSRKTNYVSESEVVPVWKIRQVLEMYARGICIEVSLKGSSSRYSAVMRGLFHCDQCFKAWNETKSRVDCTNEKNSCIPGEPMVFGKEECLHVLKIASANCYTDDENIAKTLNKMNQNIDGTFTTIARRASNRYRSDYSPVLYSTSCGRKFPGTFVFSKQINEGDNCEIFSPFFSIPITVRGVKPNKRTFAIFESTKKLSCNKAKRSSMFCTVTGKIFDTRKVFSSGLLGCFTNWEVFFSGEMMEDSFLPTACVLDSGLVFFWPRDNKKTQKIRFENIDEILELTKRSFPCFPEEKLTDRKGVWTLINDRKFCEIPTHFINQEHDIGNRSVGIIYLGDSDEESSPKITKHFKIEFHAFMENADIISRATSESEESNLEERERAVNPSGLPMGKDDINALGSSFNIPERDIGPKNSYTRRLSVAWFREMNSSEESELLRKKSSSGMLRQTTPEMINHAVRNRTGKPSTKPGQLSDGTSAVTLDKGSGHVTPRPMPMSPRKQSNTISASDFPSQFQTGTSSKEFDVQRPRTVIQRDSRATTPSTPKKISRNEFSGVKAKEKSTLPSSAESARIPTMKQRTGKLQSVRPNKRRSRNESVPEVFNVNEREEKDRKSPEIPKESEVDPPRNTIDDEEFTLPSDHFLPKVEEKKTKKHGILPFLNKYSILNFTESYRFSYFMMPGYVRDKNEQIKNGLFKLPIIKQDQTSHIRKSKDRTDLMKRIEKLNRFEGSANAPRVRQ